MKKAVKILVGIAVMLSFLAGCGSKKETVGIAADEIMTYRRLDQSKTTLVVSRSGNIDIGPLAAEFEKLNPDIQVVCLDISGGNTTATPVEDWLANGLAPDVMFWSSNLISDAAVKKYFTNLSTSSYVDCYQSQALNGVAIDANVYCLPCPSDVQCMIYNKTLFEQYGWSVPATFDEFVALCDQITADTGGSVQPWNPNAKYSNEILTVMEGFVYQQLLAGADNRSWYDQIITGSGSLSEHLQPLYQVIETLVEHGILKNEYFTYSATSRSREFQNGQIAMINYKATAFESDVYEFGFMPFPTTQGELGYVCNAYSAVVGVPVKNTSKKVAAAIDRFLTFLSSAQGQQIFIGNSLQISNVKGVTANDSGVLAQLQPAIDQGHQFSLLDFIGVGVTVNFHLTADAQNITAHNKTAEQCLQELADNPFTANDAAPATASEVIGSAAADFTILQTSFCMADMYRQSADADIGLIANNVAYRGNLMRIFKGDLTAGDISSLLPRSLANGSTLLKVTMTGAQLLQALNDPLGADDKTADCIYAYSGLKCEVAPWNELGSRYLTVTLADGSPLEMDHLYTVACFSGTVFDKYITETVQTYPGSWQQLMTAWLQENSPIAPADDGRISLVWD